MVLQPLSLITNLFFGNVPKNPGSDEPKRTKSAPILLAQAPPGQTPPVTPATPAKPFTRQSVDDLVSSNLAKIHNALNRSRGQDYSIRRLRRYPTPNDYNAIAEKYILCWLAGREIGIPYSHLGRMIRERSNVLSTAISYLKRGSRSWSVFRRRYWLPQLSLILSSELESNFMRRQLRKLLPNGTRPNGWDSPTLDARVRERLALKQFFGIYLKGKKEFSLLQGESHLRLALLWKAAGNQSNYQAQITKAKAVLKKVATLTSLKASVRRLLRGRRSRYIPSLTQRIRIRRTRNQEIRKTIARANLLMANILMLEAAALKDPNQALAKYKEAEKYLRNISPLKGIILLEATKLLAQDLLSQAYLHRNLNQPYAALFKEAETHLAYISNWVKTYKSKTFAYRRVQVPASRKVTPRWLVNIDTTVKIDLAKHHMIKVGDIRKASTIESLKAQRIALRNIAAVLISAMRAKYPYGRTRIPVIRFQQLSDLQVALAENLTRRAFIAKALGDNATYKKLLHGTQKKKGAIAILKGIFSRSANLLTRAAANLWLAKIHFVMAGDDQPSQKRRDILKDAAGYARNALAPPKKLSGSMLSSAYQTYGEILLQQKNLSEAEKMLRKAITIDKQNYGAMATLADILNQRAKHADARTIYEKLIQTKQKHFLGRQAELGKAEANMREKENYLMENINKLRAVVIDILAKEPPGSYLIVRGIHDLIEAYGAKEHLQELIILIGKTLLGLNNLTVIQDEPLKNALLGALGRKVILSSSFKSELYLKIAEVLIWRKKFKKARELLSSIPGAIATTIKKDTNLSLLSHILKAELQMREKKDITLIMKPALWNAVHRSQNPDLITRLIKDHLEAHFIKQKFSLAVKLIERYLVPAKNNPHLGPIEKLFVGRARSFNKFKFALLFSWANALFWGKEYDKALDKYADVLKEIKTIEKRNPNLARKYRTQVFVSIGDIRFIKQDYDPAMQQYRKALPLLKGLKSKQANIDRAKALVGMADIRRFVPDHQDIDKSRKLYYRAKKSLKHVSRLNPDRIRLEKRIRDGLFGIRRMTGEVSYFKTSFEFTRGSNGRLESQININTLISMGLFTPKMSWLQIFLGGQIDLGDGVRRGSLYLGPRLSYRNNFALETIFKLGTTGNEKSGIVFYRRPDLKLNLYTDLGSRYLELSATANLNFSKQEQNLNTYYGSLNIKPFAGLKSRWVRGLGLKAEYNNFYFTYLGDFQLRHSLGSGLQWKEIPLVPNIWDLDLSVLGLAYWQKQNGGFTSNGGVDLGIRTRFNLEKLFKYPVYLNFKYFYQYTPIYQLHQGSATLEVPF